MNADNTDGSHYAIAGAEAGAVGRRHTDSPMRRGFPSQICVHLRLSAAQIGFSGVLPNANRPQINGINADKTENVLAT
jgi:hypothetical protein